MPRYLLFLDESGDFTDPPPGETSTHASRDPQPASQLAGFLVESPVLINPFRVEIEKQAEQIMKAGHEAAGRTAKGPSGIKFVLGKRFHANKLTCRKADDGRCLEWPRASYNALVATVSRLVVEGAVPSRPGSRFGS